MFKESTMLIMLRFAVYTLVIFSFTIALPLFIQPGDIKIFKENGPVEWLQFSLIGGTTLALLAGAWVVPQFRPLFFLLASIAGFATVRELDKRLDRLIPWLGWKVAYVIVGCAVIMAYRNRETLKMQITRFLDSRAFSILWAGFIVAVPFSQLVGNGTFLKLVMGDDYITGYKRVIEESGELVGYFLLLAGSIESIVQMKISGLSSGATDT